MYSGGGRPHQSLPALPETETVGDRIVIAVLKTFFVTDDRKEFMHEIDAVQHERRVQASAGGSHW